MAYIYYIGTWSLQESQKKTNCRRNMAGASTQSLLNAPKYPDAYIHKYIYMSPKPKLSQASVEKSSIMLPLICGLVGAARRRQGGFRQPPEMHQQENKHQRHRVNSNVVRLSATENARTKC